MITYKEITAEDLPVMKKYMANHNHQGCEFSVGNLYMWNQDNQLRYAIVDDHIVFCRESAQRMRYSLPMIGKSDRDLISLLIEQTKQAGKTFVLGSVTTVMKQTLEELFPDTFEFTSNRDYSDYIYLVEDLQNLKGKKFHGKRNHINQFLKQYAYTYEAMSTENIPECRAMNQKWKKQNDSGLTSLETELRAVDIAFDHFDEFGFVGGLIRIDGEVVAFTIGEPLTRDTFVSHIEKAYHDIQGLYPMINQQFALHAMDGFTYVNREEDMGVEGLRKAKLSYNPVILLEKFEATLKTK